MCDGCVDMLQLLESGDHHELSKLEVSIFVTFMCNWQNRQCSCCFKDYKNFEICNNLLQKVMALAIRFINTLPEDCEREMQASGWGRARSDSERDAESAQVTEKSEKADEGKTEGAPAKDTAGDAQLGENAEESWSLQEKERLLACMVRAFTTAFPHYIAYKHMVHGTLEDLPQQETSALSNYCDTTDVELPLYLLRNVCFLIDSNGITALKNCFEKASPDNLPFGLAQILINLVANVRNWMNAHAIVQYIVPLRSILIGYMCRLSDKELKMAGNRNVIEIMCQAVKDPNEAGYMTDHMGLELHFKLFTCSTLVNRLAGLQQMTTQVTRITDSMNNDSLLEPEGMFGDGNQRRRAIAASQHRKSACARMGAELAKWMVDREIIEHIFGPNLHVEIVKQSQAVINFVADEGKMTTKHIGAMWAAAQLKHCSKQVYDVLITLVPHLSAENVNHLDALLKDLPTANLTDSVLILSSSLMKQQWMVNPLHSQSAAAIQQQPHLGMTLSALRQDEEDMDTDVTKAGQDLSSSESMQDSEEGDSQKHRQMEPGEIRHRLTGMGRGACLHDDKADSGESESSLEGQSEFSNASEDSDGGLDVEGEGRTPVVGARGPAMGKRQLPAARLASEDSDDGTDSDEDLGSGKAAEEVGEGPSSRKKRREDAGVAHQPITVPPKLAAVRKTSGAQEGSELGVAVGEHGAKAAGPVDAPKAGGDAQVYDFSSGMPHIRHHGPAFAGADFGENILSPDEGSCHSSQLSTKSEKNMADFDGEDGLSEEELTQINSHATFSAHQLPQHLAAAFHSQAHVPQSVIHHRPTRAEAVLAADGAFEDVCKEGKTMLWDIIQDDKIGQLPEGLAVEVEKILSNLLSYINDKRINLKFIEACITNLANHRSVVVSLRLITKIFSAFSRQSPPMDTHTYVMWAVKKHDMMTHFFNDLIHYAKNGSQTLSLHPHKEQVQVRLNFLTFVYSAKGSPDSLRMDLNQVDILWRYLALDPECSDDCLNWFLIQAKVKEHHGLSLDTFRHIFLEKMPSLKPENISMTGLSLFQQLSQLARIPGAPYETALTENELSGMNQLWEIALLASDKDVSSNASTYLCNYYIGYGNGTLEKEEEFVQRCMASLVKATEHMKDDVRHNLLITQRGLALLKNQLDIFRQKYAYHLRNWQIENRGILSHNQLRSPGKNASSIQLLLQAACINEKTPLEMFGTDLIAELRAEVTRYWENLQHEQRLLQQQGQPSPNTQGMAPILGAMLGDGPIRMISHGQELGFDMDEKSLADFGFKDGMIVFVSVGSIRQPRKADGTTPSSCLPPPPRDRMPMNLLLQTPHFDNLFTLLEQLSNLEVDTTLDDHQGLLADARRQSRNVWDLLMALPTSPTHLTGLNNIVSNEAAVVDWESLLPPQSPHRLYYSLQIVESLSHQAHSSKQSLMTVGGGDGQEVEIRQDTQENAWTTNFIAKQGLTHLFSIFLSGSLQPRQGDTWSQWNQECLAYLLRLISQFSILDADAEPIYDELFGESFHSPRKFRRKPKPTTERILIPRLKQSVINVLRPEAVVQILMKILFEAVLPEDTNQLYIASWGRAEVVHYALHFFLTLAFSFTEVKDLLCSAPNFTVWLKRLTMEAPEPPVRREACSGLYRLCLGQTADGRSGLCFLLPVLKSMLFFLPTAFNFKPQKNNEMESPKEKEPFGSGCRDFFWLLCRLMESLPRGDEMAAEDNDLDLDRLLTEVVSYIEEREIYETRLGCEEDDVLIGLLNLVTAILKNNPPFKESEEAKDLMDKAVTYLFDLPSPDNRILPKCKSQHAQEAAYDILVELMKGSLRNYDHGHTFFMGQHSKDAHEPYPWDYWPHDDGRSKCGYVGLTNLGATCYMATCVQHLYMIPEMREAILQAKLDEIERHAEIMSELQKMFAYLQESERKAYNPKTFCKVYTMDHQPLNTGEQKDMTEFLTDLITKMEEMSPKVKRVVRNLFGGVMTNSVVSLDCPHVSVGFDYFYTVRCQVCDMKDLFDSLDEVCVKDTLEGDNKYTCDECHNKVRAVKGSCFRRLPEFFLLNTMRYTFNMVTMLKEKVNTHFSFPLSMDVSRYMEKNVLGPEKRKDIRAAALKKGGSDNTPGDDDSTSYELIGVTVHTGTAEGGHYYSFSQDLLSQSENSQAKWYLFNDAEVKLFDPVQLPAECFGGEMVSKQYDSVGEKFVDMSFEKTNSAYMLLYARVPSSREPKRQYNFELQEHLSSWIWRDNRQFLQDKNIFEHHYFNFIWQMCYYLPTTLPRPPDNSVTLKAAQLGTCFLLETYIHSKEKPNTLQWVETLTKLFNSCHEACEWFLDLMAQSDWWPVQILIKCPNQTVRQMFQRLIIHVIKQLRESHVSQYLVGDENAREGEPDYLGCQSCVTRFIRKMLSIVEHGVKPQSKYLSEYFGLLLEFAKMGVEESSFLTKAGAIGQMIHFYMGPRNSESSSNNTITVEIVSDEEEDDDVITLSDDNMRPTSLEKMVGLISMLVERSRDDRDLNLSEKDFNAIMGGKGFPFLFNQVRDNINIQQTRNLIFSMTRWNNAAAQQVVAMIFNAIRKLSNELANNFFKLMSLLVENTAGPPGQPDYTNLILDRIWDLCRYCPTQVLEWLTGRVTNHKYIHNWVLSQLDVLVEPYLIAHNVVRVRNSAAYLLVSLVPNCSFRNSFRPPRGMLQQTKDLTINMDATEIVHQIYRHLLGLLGKAKQYVADNTLHGTTKLMCYFAVMTYCLVGKPEKLMFREYFMDLWNLFHPRLSEPQISMFHNKQALLMFWHEVCKDCPENVKLITSNPAVCRNIAFNYILADHEDQDVVIFNRMMLPNYYGLLRMCCQQSRQFTRQLACHQNIQWAFKNITPHQTQYNLAVEELMKMMKLMATRHPDATEDELKQVAAFRKSTIHMYLTSLEPRSSWQTLISALKILVETKEERLLIVYQHGLSALSEAFFTLFSMYHEATACHVVTDIIDLLTLLNQIFDTCRDCNDKKSPTSTDIKLCLNNWKDKQELVKKVVSMLNSFTPPDLRNICIDLLKQMVLTMQSEVIAIIVPLLLQAHVNFQDSNMPVTSGPYFPRRGQKEMTPKTNIRPRPQFQMLLNNSQLEVPRNVDEAYDQALSEYFVPYHLLVDVMCRVAVNMQNMSSNLITLSAMVAYEGIPLHLPYFAKLWCEIYNSPPVDRSYIKLLCNSGSFIDYVDAVLLDERQSLNNNIIYQFFLIFFPKVYQQVINETGRHLLDNLIISMAAEKSTLEGLVAEVPGPKHEKELARICSRILGDMRALMLVVNQQRFVANTVLLESLQGILQACRMYQLPEDSPSPPPTPAPTEAEPSAEAEVEAEERQLEKEPPAAMEAKAGTSKALEASQEEPMETEAVEEGSKENVSPSEDSTDKPSASAAAERAGMKRKDPAVAGTSKDGGSSLLPMDPAASQKAARDSVSSDSTKPDQSEPRPGTSHSEEPGTSQSGACAEPGTSQSGLGGRGVDALFLGPRRPRLMEMVIKLCESLLTMFQSTSIPASPSP